MKKPFLLVLTALLGSQLTYSQTLTQAAKEPVAGDVHSFTGYDSTTIIPNTTGLNQVWNFSSLVTNTMGVTSSTFMPAASAPSSTMFPGATLAEYTGTEYIFYQSSPNQFETRGSFLPGAPASVVDFTNSIINFSWPVAYNSSFSDTYYGTMSGGATGTYNGSYSVTGTGTGSIVIGATTYSNILQVKIVNIFTGTFSAPFPATLSGTVTQYDYYSPLYKFPLVTINYNSSSTGFGTSTEANISMNSAISCITPSLQIAQSNTVICPGQSATLTASGADTYTWVNSSGNGAQQVITPTVTTTYTLTGLNNNCVQSESLTITQVVSACTALKQEALDDLVGSYPNPFESTLKISNASSSEAQLFIYDALGNLVYEAGMQGEETKTIDTERYSKGLYILTVSGGAGTSTKKLVKQ